MKFFTVLTVILGISVLLGFSGMQTNTSGLVSSFNIYNQSSGTMQLNEFTNSSLWITLIAILIGATATSIIIGFFTGTTPENLLTATVATILATLAASDIIFVSNTIMGLSPTWIDMIVFTIMALTLVSLYIGLFEFWKGGDG